MVPRCYKDGRFEQAVGIALESRRLDKLEETVNRSQDRAAILVYALRVCQDLVIHKGFRQEVRLLSMWQRFTPCLANCLSLIPDNPNPCQFYSRLIVRTHSGAALHLHTIP